MRVTYTVYLPCQAEGSDLRQRLGEQTERLREAEQDGEQKDVRLEELHRLLGGMEHESAALRESMRGREEELGELQRMSEFTYKRTPASCLVGSLPALPTERC